jgi:hypothetical protein
MKPRDQEGVLDPRYIPPHSAIRRTQLWFRLNVHGTTNLKVGVSVPSRMYALDEANFMLLDRTSHSGRPSLIRDCLRILTLFALALTTSVRTRTALHSCKPPIPDATKLQLTQLREPGAARNARNSSQKNSASRLRIVSLTHNSSVPD